jgi:hypothetical protein
MNPEWDTKMWQIRSSKSIIIDWSYYLWSFFSFQMCIKVTT